MICNINQHQTPFLQDALQTMIRAILLPVCITFFSFIKTMIHNPAGICYNSSELIEGGPLTMNNDNHVDNNFILSTDLTPGYDTGAPTETKKSKYIKLGIAAAAIAVFIILVVL